MLCDMYKNTVQDAHLTMILDRHKRRQRWKKYSDRLLKYNQQYQNINILNCSIVSSALHFLW